MKDNTANVKTDETKASDKAQKRILELEAKLHAWEEFGVEATVALDTIVNEKHSVMMSDSRFAEIQIQTQRSLLHLISRINELK